MRASTSVRRTANQEAPTKGLTSESSAEGVELLEGLSSAPAAEVLAPSDVATGVVPLCGWSFRLDAIPSGGFAWINAEGQSP